jgi:acyl-CoA synthetase (AMP-forming)/AMP-acid ligase II
VAQVPSDFLELVRRERVTVLNQVPSAFRHLREAWEEDGRPDLPVRHLIFGGESVDLADVARFVDACGAAPPAVVNMYGITEATVHVTRKPLARGDMEGLAVAPIGRPLPHLSVDVLDPAGRRVEPGEVGEMWVAGAGVAAGYLNRPELTAERFRTIEIGGNLLRAYRTGDLARVLPDGELDFAGRADEQIKVRGFRIEPREVEMALSRHRLVRGAAVAVVRDAAGEPSLVACVVASDAAGQGALADLRRHSAYVLPRWMVPDRFLLVEALPLTPRGKLDRAALGRLAGGDAPGRTRTGAASDRLDRERDAVRGGDAID